MSTASAYSLRRRPDRPSRGRLLSLVARSRHTGGAIDGIYDDGDLTGSDVRVYVVDTGVQGSHQDFAGRVVSGHTTRVHSQCASCQAVKGVLPADGSRCQGHGTHVASTVGGLKHGVAKNVTIVPVFSCFGLTCSDGSLEQF